MVAPAAMSIFNLLQLLTLFICQRASHLLMRFGNDLMDSSPCVSPNVSELDSCFVDDRRNLGELFWSQIEFRAEPFLHSRGDPLGMVNFKEMMPGVCSPHKRASNSTGDKHQKKSGDEFPLQRLVHFENSSWIAESAIANSFVSDSRISRL